MMSDLQNEKAYARILAQREKNIARNATEGRSMDLKGTSISEPKYRSDTLSNVMDDIKGRDVPVTNLNNKVTTTPDDLLGLTPELKYKSRFPSVNKALGNDEITKTVNNANNELSSAGKYGSELAEGAEGASMASKLLNNSKGFINGIAPAIGLGSAALAGLDVANKANNGQYKDAALSAIDNGSYFVPVLGEARMMLDAGKNALSIPNAGAADTDTTNLKPYNFQTNINDSARDTSGSDVIQPRAQLSDLRKISDDAAQRMKVPDSIAKPCDPPCDEQIDESLDENNPDNKSVLFNQIKNRMASIGVRG
jgi:hypothetical protein